MGASKKAFMEIYYPLPDRYYELIQEMKENKKYEEIQYSKLHKIQKRSKK